MSERSSQTRDVYTCEALRQILTAYTNNQEQKIDSAVYEQLFAYLQQLPSEDFHEPARMANHITSFCQQPENKILYEWLGEIYDRLDDNGIEKIVKQTLDPGDKADKEPDSSRIIQQKGRDICQNLERLVGEWQEQNNREQQNTSKSK